MYLAEALSSVLTDPTWILGPAKVVPDALSQICPWNVPWAQIAIWDKKSPTVSAGRAE